MNVTSMGEVFWDATTAQGLLYPRRVVSVDAARSTVTLDAPTRYGVLTRDNARLIEPSGYLKCVAWRTSPSACADTDERRGDDARAPRRRGRRRLRHRGDGGLRGAQAPVAIRLDATRDAWLYRVESFAPTGDTSGAHVLSSAVFVTAGTHRVTLERCRLGRPQYRGGGGNGYLYWTEGDNNLLVDDVASGGRHNFITAHIASSGNVVLRARTVDARYSDDGHRLLAQANLFDAVALEGAWLQAVNRGATSSGAGFTATETVFWNTRVVRAHASTRRAGDGFAEGFAIETAQFGWGYAIGTSGVGSGVATRVLTNSYWASMDHGPPADFVEGVGRGATLSLSRSTTSSVGGGSCAGSDAGATARPAGHARCLHPTTGAPSARREDAPGGLRHTGCSPTGAMRTGLLLLCLAGCTPATPAAPAPAIRPEPSTPAARVDAPAPVDLVRALGLDLAVSSTIHNFTNVAWHLADGDPATAWNSRTGDLAGAWIEARVPEGARVTAIRLTVGYTKTTAEGRDLFALNHRVARVRVTRDGVGLGMRARPRASVAADGARDGRGGRLPGGARGARAWGAPRLAGGLLELLRKMVGTAPCGASARRPVVHLGSLDSKQRAGVRSARGRPRRARAPPSRRRPDAQRRLPGALRARLLRRPRGRGRRRRRPRAPRVRRDADPRPRARVVRPRRPRRGRPAARLHAHGLPHVPRRPRRPARRLRARHLPGSACWGRSRRATSPRARWPRRARPRSTRCASRPTRTTRTSSGSSPRPGTTAARRESDAPTRAPQLRSQEERDSGRDRGERAGCGSPPPR